MVGPALLTTIYIGTRAQNSASESALLVLDADGKGSDSVKIGQVIKLFQDAELECVVYTSPSNQDAGVFRVVVPLKERSMFQPNERMPGADSLYWGYAGRAGIWHVDEGKSNPYSLFVVPGNFTYSTYGNERGKLLSEHYHIAGEIFDATAWIAAYHKLIPSPSMPLSE